MKKNRYLRKTIRLQSWNYQSNSTYFITICTANKEHFFGEVVNQKMYLNEIGELAKKFWMEIPDHFPFVKLKNFVVMPNHMHGILIIDKPVGAVVGALHCNVLTTERTLQCNVPTNQNMSKISPKPGSISTIIRSYKSVVTKNARYIYPRFGWQSRFHDHIIRNEKSFQNIQHYIANNPAKWDDDCFRRAA